MEHPIHRVREKGMRNSRYLLKSTAESESCNSLISHREDSKWATTNPNKRKEYAALHPVRGVLETCQRRGLIILEETVTPRTHLCISGSQHY